MVTRSEDQIATAREFYRERLSQSFRYSGGFRNQTGRGAEDISNAEGFEAILRESPTGSLDAARRIGEMAVVYLDKATPLPGAWWRDLCNYERGYFMQLATTDMGPPTNRPRRGVSALCMNFDWAAPELLDRLASGQPITEDLKRKVALLFSRGHGGKVNVVEVGPKVEKVFRAMNGLRTLDQIVASAGLDIDEANTIILSLAEIGAVQMAAF